MKTVLLYTFLLSIKLISFTFDTPNTDKDDDIVRSTKSTNAEATALYDKAMAFLNNKEIETAIDHLNKAVLVDPEFVDAYDQLAQIYISKSEYMMAKLNATKSLELYPEGYMANMNFGKIYENIRDFATALTYYDKCTRIQPENPDGYYKSGKMYFVANDFQKSLVNALIAEKYYKKQQNPLTVDAVYLAGMSYHGLGVKKNAKKYLKKAQEEGLQLPEEIRMMYGL